ncbi:juvenile hormone acid O-methyltransferase-like [Stomoxys calcitrans]|uniref:juvenile hormone acid O-methyltransferase-like n=1 Tax=Stomoxys calcitrans TaxID=35570 RepID=UPI0027E3140F|nr:juvenile hormone acid O-methyltransferase-like [Stomoxys calcitrans]XP_013111204.2 juvenile hormone acid O-methyltransferase-like [Stomoxys calcitrans]
MHSPLEYRKAHQAQREDASQLIEECLPKLKWRFDGHDTLIDVGSSSGDILFDFIYPIMPKNFTRVVCTDVNPKMVKYAKEIYGTYAKTEFRTLNIECQEGVGEQFKGRFDHVTSFYALHWTKDLRKAFRNIYELLRNENGDCLLLFLINWSKVYGFYDILRNSVKWSQYINNLERLTAPLHYSKDPRQDLMDILNDLGFSKYDIEIKDRIVHYDSEEIFRDNMVAISPFITNVPLELQEQFGHDLVEAAASLGCRDEEDGSFRISYKVAVVLAIK